MNLYKHQIESIELAERNAFQACIFLDCGLGKTVVAFETFRKFRHKNPGACMIAMCPKSLIESAWQDDYMKFYRGDFSFSTIDYYKKKRVNTEILVMNYEQLITKDGVNNIVKFINGRRALCVCDESTQIKESKAKRTKTLHRIGYLFFGRIIMTGTPAPNSLMNLWSQVQFVKVGKLTNNFYSFRNKYFHLERGKAILEMRGKILSRDAAKDLFQKGWKWAVSKDKEQLIMDEIKPFSIFRRKEECLDLPEQIDTVRFIEFTPDEMKMYRKMKNELVLELKDVTVTAPMMLTKLMKLRQLTSGFILDETGKAHNTSDRKMKELLAITEGSSEQMIIWANFIHEIESLVETLSKKYGPESVVTYYSGTADRQESIESFRSGNARFFIGNPQSCAHGITLVNCNTQIWYSLSYSYEHYIQGKQRTHRIGQSRACVYIHLLVKNTIDENIYKVLQKKIDINEFIKDVLR